jgi:acetyl-CoA synthetase
MIWPAMPGPHRFFGPNCCRFVNFFDRVAMMPDQIVGPSVERGVALICQSGTIALTLMFNHRSVPIGCLFTVGNQTRLAVEDLIEVLCDDARGRHSVCTSKHQIPNASHARPRAMLQAPLPSSSRAAPMQRRAPRHSHAGALAGADEIFEAFCRQAGIARCDTLATLCETLKLFHMGGPLAGRRVLVMGASGGDMAMTADVSRDMKLEFAPLSAERAATLREVLTDRVTIANPFDIHTYYGSIHRR